MYVLDCFLVFGDKWVIIVIYFNVELFCYIEFMKIKKCGVFEGLDDDLFFRWIFGGEGEFVWRINIWLSLL